MNDLLAKLESRELQDDMKLLKEAAERIRYLESVIVRRGRVIQEIYNLDVFDEIICKLPDGLIQRMDQEIMKGW